MIENKRAPGENELDIAAIRERLAGARGKEYWTSLEELAETPSFTNYLHREFGSTAADFLDSMSRRRFLKVMGASLGLAGVTACGARPREDIVPYVRNPEQLVQGKPLFYATAMSLGGYATGLLVEQHEGRPTKIEGNPDHPASYGATDTFAQASVLDLYDPDRSKVVLKNGRISTYNDFLADFRGALGAQRPRKGAGIRVLTETITSPTLAAQVAALLKEFPGARVYQYEPVGRDNAREGARLAFGRAVDPVFRFAEADVVLSLDGEFLGCFPGNTQYVRDFATRRRPEGEREMNRFYAVESTPSNTGAKADHRLPMRASEIEGFARALASRLGVAGIAAGQTSAPAQFLDAVVKDLQAHKGASLVVAGPNQPAAVHALAHAMNSALGNFGKTVEFIDAPNANIPSGIGGLQELLTAMDAGQVDMLVMLGGDPVYTAPADLRFGERLQRYNQGRREGRPGPISVHVSMYEDHTTQLSTWHIPQNHYLESWGDARAADGTVSIVQPLIEPLYPSRTMQEVMAAFSETPEKSSHDLVREYWQTQRRGGSFDTFWQTWLHNGFIENTALRPVQVALSPNLARQLGQPRQPGGGLELMFQPDPSIYDGRFVNNGWLQELPKPITKLTWDNAALISPKLAEELKIDNEDVVELRLNGRTLLAPVLIVPGHPQGSVSLHLGYGQQATGRVGSGTGVNAYTLRTTQAPWFGSGLEIRNTGQTYTLATTQKHHGIEGRTHVRSASLAAYEKDEEVIKHQGGHEVQDNQDLYPDYSYPTYRWGMVIDMSTCVGCNSCVVACQAENNVPVVGKDQVANSREMHWLRIDTYFAGHDIENPVETVFQPMLCVHCEKAPCEVVCPVTATLHDVEGLNVMVYNRCIGTRYCSNNCPWKVRRFNWLMYSDKKTELLKMVRNPDVTVRERGVMEKCTYCTQRISAARIHAAKEEGRAIEDGEVITACQAACPADAIVFGDLNDEKSRVHQLKTLKRNYAVLGELGTIPRTTWLALIRNPNPELEAEGTEIHG